MIPVGDGWRCAVNFIGDHKEILQLNPDLCLDTLIKWTLENHEGETTKAAGRIALYILKESENHWANWHSEELKIYTIIENSAKAIVSELNDLIGSQLNIPDDNKVQDSYYAFFEYIITDSLRAANIIQSCPMAVLNLCKQGRELFGQFVCSLGVTCACGGRNGCLQLFAQCLAEVGIAAIVLA